MSKIFTVRLPESLATAIDTESDEYGYDSRAEYVRTILKERHRLRDQPPDPSPAAQNATTGASDDPTQPPDTEDPEATIDDRIDALEARVRSLEALHDSERRVPATDGDREDPDSDTASTATPGQTTDRDGDPTNGTGSGDADSLPPEPAGSDRTGDAAFNDQSETDDETTTQSTTDGPAVTSQNAPTDASHDTTSHTDSNGRSQSADAHGASTGAKSDTDAGIPADETLVETEATTGDYDTADCRRAGRAVLEYVRTSEDPVDSKAIADNCYEAAAPDTMAIETWWDSIARPTLHNGIEAGVIEYSATHQCYHWVGAPSSSE